MINTRKILSTLSLLLLLLNLISIVPVKVSAEPVIETVRLTCSEDTYVDERDQYRDTNFGDSTVLNVGSSPVGNMRTFIKFDLSELPYGSVRSAKLILNATEVPLGQRTYEVYAVWGPWDNASWTEENLTWNNQPGWMDMLDEVSIGGIDATPGLIELDVKEAVKMWINRWWPNHGFLIRDRNEWSPAKFVTQFKSKEAGTPILEIEIVISPTFELSVYPSMQASPPGGSTEWWIHLRSVNGWSGTINLEPIKDFDGSIELESTTVNLNPYGDVGLKATVTAGIVPKGQYSFIINATSGSEFSYDEGTLYIVPAPILRTLPESITTIGESINVSLRYIPGSIDGFDNNNPTGLIVTEYLPWYLTFDEDSNPISPQVVKLVNMENGDPYDNQTQLVWMFADGYEDVNLSESFTWSYIVNFTVPEGMEWHQNELWWSSGDWKAIDGSSNQMQGQILGDNKVKFELGLPGSWDDDGFIDDWEILQAIVYWKEGKMNDNELLEYVQLWINSMDE